MNEQATAQLEILKAAINKQFGEHSVITLDQKSIQERENVFDTGSISLNVALGIGGYPRGRIVEIYGNPASGKTSLCLHAIASAQKAGCTCAFIDVEQAIDTLYCESLGVQLDKLMISQPDYAEQALDIADTMVKSGIIHLIVIDSVAALVPKAELDGEMSEMQVGLQARIMGKALRKLAPGARASGCTVIFTNQLRQNVGVIYGPKETTSGGLALRFDASQRIETKRVTDLKDGDDILGQTVKAKVVKNKLAPAMRSAEIDIIFGKGIDTIGELIEYALLDGLLVKKGAWFQYKDKSIAQGKLAAREWLLENPDILTSFRDNILEVRGLK